MFAQRLPFFELSIRTLGMPSSWIVIGRLPDESVVNVEQDTASMTVVFALQPEDEDGIWKLAELEDEDPRLDSTEISGGFEMSSSVGLSVVIFI